MAKSNLVRATLKELWTRLIKPDKTINWIYLNGENNLYPNECERVILLSPTATRSANMFAKYVAGAGVRVSKGSPNIIAYKDLPFVNNKQQKITNIINIAAKSLSKHRGVFFWVGYGLKDAKLIPNQIEVLDYKKCRLSKEDASENKGKVYFHDWEAATTLGGSKKNMKWFYPFNNNEDVILAQIKADAKEQSKKAGVEIELEEAIKNYRGQVFYLNLDSELIYSLSTIDSVYNEADTENRISLHSNNEVRTGFLGKTAVITNGLDEDTAKDVVSDVSKWLGAENSASLYHLDLEEVEDIDKAFKILQVGAQYNEKLFIETSKRLKTNIFGAFNNIPEPLVMSSASALFGTAADTYTEMKLFYSEQTETEREELQEALALLGFPVIIKPIVEVAEVSTDTPEVNDAIANAQAALRGSVSGVQALLAIQASVAAGTTDIESAIAMLINIFGFSREVSAALLGKPEIDAETVNKFKNVADVFIYYHSRL